MHTRVLTLATPLVALAPIVALGPAPASAAPCPSTTAEPTGSALAAQVSSTLCLLNAERAQRGLAPLRANRTLGRAARRHARDMVRRRFFSHVSPNGATVDDRVRRAGYRGCRRTGETIAWGTGPDAAPAAVVQVWMASPDHRRVILDPNFRDIGLGVAMGSPQGSGGGATVTVDFALRD